MNTGSLPCEVFRPIPWEFNPPEDGGADADNSKLNEMHWDFPVAQASCVPGCMNKCVAIRSREVAVPIDVAFVIQACPVSSSRLDQIASKGAFNLNHSVSQ